MSTKIYSAIEKYAIPVFPIKSNCRLKSLTYINRLANLKEGENYINFGKQSIFITPKFYASRQEILAEINLALLNANSKIGFGEVTTENLASISHAHISSQPSLNTTYNFLKLTTLEDSIWGGKLIPSGKTINAKSIDIQTALGMSYDLTLTDIESPNEIEFTYFSDGTGVITSETKITSAKVGSFKVASDLFNGEFEFSTPQQISSFTINQGVPDSPSQPNNFSPVLTKKPLSIPFIQISNNGSVTQPISPSGEIWNSIGYSQSEKPTSFLTECGEFTLMTSEKLELRLSMSESVFDGSLIYAFSPNVPQNFQAHEVIQSSIISPRNSYVYISGGLINGRYLLEVEKVN